MFHEEAVKIGEQTRDALTIEPLASTTGTPSSVDESAYLSRMTVKGVSVAPTTLGGKGVFGEVKNQGDRTLSEVEIRIYYVDRTGSPIFEKAHYPVLVSKFGLGDSNGPLKPGYSRKFGYGVEEAPSDWSGKVNIKVAKVRFADAESNK
jgi:hypothetical protein